MQSMKYLFLIIFVVLASCSDRVKSKQRAKHTCSTLSAGDIRKNIKCLSDTSVSYTLYLPKGHKAGVSLSPVLFFFDAHQRGVLPVKKYKELADRYGIIFVGSNSSENGQQPGLSKKIVRTTINDVKNRLNVDKKNILVAGFSGGARVAVSAALTGAFGIRGVIGCAAGFPNVQSLAGMNFRWVGVVGNRDFNYLELVNVNRQLKSSGFDSHLLVFDGKHEWPPVEVVDESLEILFGGKAREFVEDPASRQWENKEIEGRQFLANAMKSKDLSWWNEKIATLENSSRQAASESERLMNARLLSFMSMVSFMYANSAIQQNRPEAAKKYLTIYEKVDSENPDVYFLRAEYSMLTGNDKEALTMLEKSAQLGYADREKLLTDRFFTNLKRKAPFKNIIEKVTENKEKE